MSTEMKLFYDGSCRLCRVEIAHLAPKLQSQLQLVDISEQEFEGFQGVSKNQMMAQIHLWNGSEFLIGLEATFAYWRLAGLRFLPWLLSLPGINQLARQAYTRWARKRQGCTNQACELP